MILDRDAQRELSRAAARVVFLETALRVVKMTACSSPADGAACDCCKRMRDFAASALEAK